MLACVNDHWGQTHSSYIASYKRYIALWLYFFISMTPYFLKSSLITVSAHYSSSLGTLHFKVFSILVWDFPKTCIPSCVSRRELLEMWISLEDFLSVDREAGELFRALSCCGLVLDAAERRSFKVVRRVVLLVPLGPLSQRKVDLWPLGIPQEISFSCAASVFGSI